MAEGKGKRPGGRSAQVRDAVVRATLQILSESGMAGWGIGDVAKRAGVHETSVYRRWGSRERVIFDAMIEQSAAQLPTPDTGELRGDLIAIGQSLVAYLATPLGQALTRTLAVSDDDPDTAATRRAYWDARFAEGEVVIARAIKRLELDKSVDARSLLETFIAPMHFRLLLSRENVDAAAIERFADITLGGANLPRSSHE